MVDYLAFPDVRFDGGHLIDGALAVLRCNACGSIVFDMIDHDLWHETIVSDKKTSYHRMRAEYGCIRQLQKHDWIPIGARPRYLNEAVAARKCETCDRFEVFDHKSKSWERKEMDSYVSP